jgi:hypothetical protein
MRLVARDLMSQMGLEPQSGLGLGPGRYRRHRYRRRLVWGSTDVVESEWLEWFEGPTMVGAGGTGPSGSPW